MYTTKDYAKLQFRGKQRRFDSCSHEFYSLLRISEKKIIIQRNNLKL